MGLIQRGNRIVTAVTAVVKILIHYQLRRALISPPPRRAHIRLEMIIQRNHHWCLPILNLNSRQQCCGRTSTILLSSKIANLSRLGGLHLARIYSRTAPRGTAVAVVVAVLGVIRQEAILTAVHG
ncbi:hypothetical protein EMPG_16823 [Blastomyces silverae]|uniref:Uncharacterized protein n=1 Tax=Blastomyces silverae TaxID=2060906 RepID=A0A0H1B8B7_9EURO|nr:hypothetical protein EMPG_16823 [Blastomyces silverae]